MFRRSMLSRNPYCFYAFPVVLMASLPVAPAPQEMPDVPEEVLRTEIITEARSPVDGKPLSAAEYAELQEELKKGAPVDPKTQVSPQLRRTVNLLKLRKFIKTVFPFIPIK